MPKKYSGRSVGVYIIGSVGLVVFVGLMLARIFADRGQFALSFQWDAAPSIALVAMNLGVLYLVLRRGVRTEAQTWFVLYIIALTLAAFAEMFVRLSVLPAGAAFWLQFFGMGLPLMTAALFFFVIAYTGGSTMRYLFVTPMLLITATLLAFMYSGSNLVLFTHSHKLLKSTWGYNADPGQAFLLVLLWYFAIFTVSLVLLTRFRRRASSEIIRRQAGYYIIAFLVPFVGGAVGDGILPLVGVNNLPSAIIPFSTFLALAIYVGSRRYRILEIDPTLLAQNILNTMREAVVVARNDLHVDFMNDEAARLLDVQAQNKGALEALFAPGSWDYIKAHLLHGTPLPAEVGFLHAFGAGGKRVPIRLVSSYWQDNTRSAHVLVLTDMTETVDSYNKIRDLLSQSQVLQQQLADEKAGVEQVVQARTRELRVAQDRLKAEDRMKREFIALSSHNLSTPLSVMKGSLQLIKDDKAAAEQREQLLGVFENGLNRLNEFVNDMSAIAMLESGGKIHMEHVLVHKLLEPIIAEMSVFCQAKHLAFHTKLTPGDITIFGSAMWLRNCIHNLFDNALKFTKQGSITLTTQMQNGFLHIKVSDTGIGIAEGELILLFTKFHRGTDFEQYNYEGAGLGLYLTKLIIEQHGGHIAVDSKLGQGSAFTLSLPLKPPASIATRMNATPPRNK